MIRPDTDCKRSTINDDQSVEPGHSRTTSPGALDRVGDPAPALMQVSTKWICPSPVTSMRRAVLGRKAMATSAQDAMAQMTASTVLSELATGTFAAAFDSHMHTSTSTLAIARWSKAHSREDRIVVDNAIDISGAMKRTDGSVSEPAQALEKIRVPLVPPKPNEFLTAILMDMSRAVFAQ